MQIITVTRLVLSKEEKITRKKWGDRWRLMTKDEKKYGHAYLLALRWSGYLPHQARIVHREYIDATQAPNIVLKSIKFVDGTYLHVEIDTTTIERALLSKTEPIDQYAALLREARESCQVHYEVQPH